MFEVDGYRAPPAVHDLLAEVIVRAGQSRTVCPVHADDISPHVCQQHRGERTRPEAAEFEHSQSAQRACSYRVSRTLL